MAWRGFEHRLAVRLDRRHAIGPERRNGAGRADGRVHVVGAVIGRLDRLRRRDRRQCAACCGVSILRAGLAFSSQSCMPSVPGRAFSTSHLAASNNAFAAAMACSSRSAIDADERAVAHDLHDARHLLGCAGVERGEFGLVGGRADDLSVEHALRAASRGRRSRPRSSSPECRRAARTCRHTDVRWRVSASPGRSPRARAPCRPRGPSR